MKKINFGIIGAGVIATQFATEAMALDGVNLRAIASRGIEGAQKLASKCDIDLVYESVDEMLLDETIDAIYVATFHPTHPFYSKKALEHGKHVLCEKPATLTLAQFDEIAALAKSKELLYMEALTVGFNPVYQEIKALIADGEIGEVQYVESSMGAMSKKVHKHTPELAGGCVYDIGIYNLFLINDLLGPIESIQTQKRMHRIWDVVGTVQMIATHEGGGQSYSYMTMDTLSTGRATILGSEGTIEIAPGWSVPSKFTVKKADGETYTKAYDDIKWLSYETAAFVGYLQNKVYESPIMRHELSRDMQKSVAMIYENENLILPEDAIL